MKPFSLEEAKAGKPVCTRDGRDARIVCFNRKGVEYSIIALVDDNGFETVHNYNNTGRAVNNICSLDIFMKSKKVTYHYAIFKNDKDTLQTTTFLKDGNCIPLPSEYQFLESRTIEVEE